MIEKCSSPTAYLAYQACLKGLHLEDSETQCTLSMFPPLHLESWSGFPISGRGPWNRSEMLSGSLGDGCYNFSYFALFTYVFSLFLEVSHGAAALTHFSLTHIVATLLTHCTAVVLTYSIAILIALPHWCSIYSGQSCRLFFS